MTTCLGLCSSFPAVFVATKSDILDETSECFQLCFRQQNWIFLTRRLDLCSDKVLQSSLRSHSSIPNVIQLFIATFLVLHLFIFYTTAASAFLCKQAVLITLDTSWQDNVFLFLFSSDPSILGCHRWSLTRTASDRSVASSLSNH